MHIVGQSFFLLFHSIPSASKLFLPSNYLLYIPDLIARKWLLWVEFKSPEKMCKLQPQVPVNVILFGNWVLAEMIKLRWGRDWGRAWIQGQVL